MKKYLCILCMVNLFLFSQVTAQPSCSFSPPQTITPHASGTINLKILLVQFTDIQCRKLSGYTPKYTKSNFEELLGSAGIYVSPVRYSPDSDVLYGILNDYFQKMSNGNLSINATLLNPTDGSGRPQWVTLLDTKMNYHTYVSGTCQYQ